MVFVWGRILDETPCSIGPASSSWLGILPVAPERGGRPVVSPRGYGELPSDHLVKEDVGQATVATHRDLSENTAAYLIGFVPFAVLGHDLLATHQAARIECRSSALGLKLP